MARLTASRYRGALPLVATVGFAALTIWPISVGVKAGEPLRLATVCSIAIIVGTGLLGIRLLVSGGVRPALLIVLAFSYTWFGVAALLQTSAGYYPVASLFGVYLEADSTLTLGWATILTGIAATVGGYHLRVQTPRRAVFDRVIDLRRTEIVGWLGLGVSLMATALLGGHQRLFERRDAFEEMLGVNSDSLVGTGILSSGLRVAPLIPCLALIAVFTWRFGAKMSRRQDKRLRVLTGALLVQTVLVSNPVSSPRVWFAVAIGSLAMARTPMNSFRRQALFGTLLIVGLVVVLPYLDAYRRVNAVDFESESIATSLATSADYGMYAQVLMGSVIVARDGHSMGRQILSAALFFIPRSVWTDKAVDTGDHIADGLGLPDRLNPSSPLWVEFLIDGGLLAVLVGSAAFGFLLANGDVRYVESLNRSHPTLFYVVWSWFPLYCIFLLRGSLLGAMPRLAVMVALSIACSRAAPKD